MSRLPGPRLLVPGDTVGLEVAGIGVLRNRIGSPRGHSAPHEEA
ncbi:MAG TPA: hypothetical protein VMV92_36060 [Streptosporangiaceae bacterium]|nr:hypothetical protein [Streptosporangiaceae bacterium]